MAEEIEGIYINILIPKTPRLELHRMYVSSQMSCDHVKSAGDLPAMNRAGVSHPWDPKQPGFGKEAGEE